MKLSGYEAYTLFQSLKLHFTTERYNFFTYQGKVNMSTDAFLRNKDRFLYEKLARKYNADQLKGLMIANFIHDKVWIRDHLDEEGYERYVEHLKVTQSLTYMFTNDIDKMFSSVKDPKDLFRVKPNQNPLILEMLLRNEVTLETCCILNSFVEFSKQYDEKMKDDYIWEKLRMKISKYTPFIEFDRKKFGKILKDKIG
jgi:hypothetical protein